MKLRKIVNKNRILLSKRLLFCDAFFFLYWMLIRNAIATMIFFLNGRILMLNRFKNVITFFKMTRAINPYKKLYVKNQSLMNLRGKKFLVEYYKILS